MNDAAPTDEADAALVRYIVWLIPRERRAAECTRIYLETIATAAARGDVAGDSRSDPSAEP